MRDLKFKAYHKGEGKMYWFDLMWGNHNQGNGYIGMVPWGESQNTPGRYRGNMTLVDPEECEIMQFTGLLDKNGVEIYEGDKVKIDSQGLYESGEGVFVWCNWEESIGERKNWMVKKGGWVLKTKCQQIWTSLTIEVTDNIHDK